MDLGIRGLTDAVQIGRGGFAVVYRAFQPAFERTVAVKIFGNLQADDATIAAFERECRAIGRIADRANILTVHEEGRTVAGVPYLVMAYMARGSLGDLIEKSGPIPWPKAVDIGVKLARALQVAHDSGILHRDVKPDNVLISDDDEPQLADFGIARLISSTRRTRDGMAFTPPYAAPETLAGEAATPAVDIYALACTLFTIMAGRPAFVETPDDDLVAIMHRVATSPPPDLLRPRGVPEAVCRVIEDGMAKDPDARQSSAAALAADLDAARITTQNDTKRVLDPTKPYPDRSDSWVRLALQRRALKVGLPLLLVALVVAAIVALASQHRSTASTVTTTSISTPARTTVSTTPPSNPGQSSPPSTVGSSPAPKGLVLGTQLKEISSVPCRGPHFDTGSSWQIGAVQVAGTQYQSAYSCNLFASGIGSLDFVLGKQYRLLSVTIGFAADSVSLQHSVKFEVVGDDATYLISPQTLRFGQTMNLMIDVSGITRLQLRVTELGLGPDGGAPSRPVWANPALT